MTREKSLPQMGDFVKKNRPTRFCSHGSVNKGSGKAQDQPERLLCANFHRAPGLLCALAQSAQAAALPNRSGGRNPVVRENGSQAPLRLSKGQRQPACTGVAHGVCGALRHGLGQKRAPTRVLRQRSDDFNGQADASSNPDGVAQRIGRRTDLLRGFQQIVVVAGKHSFELGLVRHVRMVQIVFPGQQNAAHLVVDSVPGVHGLA